MSTGTGTPATGCARRRSRVISADGSQAGSLVNDIGDAECEHIDRDWLVDHDGWQVDDFYKARKAAVGGDDCVAADGRVRSVADVPFVVVPADGAAGEEGGT